MTKFKVGDLVRVKARKDIPSNYHSSVALIVEITTFPKCPYLVLVQGRNCQFAEDELEKI